MNGKSLCVAILAASVAFAAVAQTKSGPKLYRWVDKQGKVHYDDALPPEAVNQARREFSTKTGSLEGEVERALTPEERAALEAQRKAAEQAALRTGEQKRQEDAMMETYVTENDLRRAYGERITLLTTTLQSTEISIGNVRENLAIMLAQASDTELQGRTVTSDRIKVIQELHAEQVKQQAFQVNRRAELELLNGEFARLLARYRELKAAAAAPAPAAAPTPPPPPGG